MSHRCFCTEALYNRLADWHNEAQSEEKGGAAVRERETVENLGRYRLRQRAHLPKLGTDSNQLAQFVTLHARERVCDLGCGVGVLGLAAGPASGRS